MTKKDLKRNPIAFLGLLLAIHTCPNAAIAQTTMQDASRAPSSFVHLTEREVNTASRVLKALGSGRRNQVLQILEAERVTHDRLQNVLSAIYVLLVNIKYDEVKKNGDCCLGQSREVKEWLTETRAELDDYVMRYFGGYGSDYKAAKQLIKAHRTDLAQVLYLPICQDR